MEAKLGIFSPSGSAEFDLFASVFGDGMARFTVCFLGCGARISGRRIQLGHERTSWVA
jgi:hypothetical protein